MIWWAMIVPYLATLGVAVLAILKAGRDPAALFVGLALFTSFVLSSMQLVLGIEGISNVFIQAVWPVATVTVLIWGIAGQTRDAVRAMPWLLLAALLSPFGLTWPDLLVRPLVALVLLDVLWRSPYRDTTLGTALAVYYLLPLPLVVAMQTVPEAFAGLFVGYRACHLVGVLLMARWVVARPPRAHMLAMV